MAGEELDRGPYIPVISDFISREIKRLESLKVEPDHKKRDFDTLDVLFRQFVTDVWTESWGDSSIARTSTIS